MYQSFYGFREKPFSLLPDSGFLYLSGKHRMALTLLEYGLMNQAGFTVISGGIGTGKTTLIRKLLNDIDPTLKVGLISNTHQTFGDLLQWIALAYDLPHQGKDKVQLYQDFMEFIIHEYAQGRRTVLIVDEAQNMPADTLEELRMLSNINADKDQVLQIILVGQRELRETLKRPDLVQFAQRIGVDYHLEPLDAEETSDYIRHRCKTAGGKAELFSDQVCQLIHQYSGGVPRLINLLCDTALVYGYAEQRDRVDATLVEEVAKEKQKGGLFPIQNAAPEIMQQNPVRSADITPVTQAHNPASITPVSTTTDKSHQLRVAITADSELLRIYLSRLLTRFGIEVVATLPLTARDLRALPASSIDVLLVELDDNMDHLDDALYEILEEWEQPVLFNDNLVTEASLSQPDRLDYGRKLSQKLYSLVPQAPQSVA